jgi:hypothetical protein
LGVAALGAIRNNEFGVMVCLRMNVLSKTPLVDILGKMKNLDEETISLTDIFCS